MAPIAEVASAIDSVLEAAPAKKAARKKGAVQDAGRQAAEAAKRPGAAKAAGRKKPAADAIRPRFGRRQIGPQGRRPRQDDAAQKQIAPRLTKGS